ncbi:hypothetical protein [Chamaesiphon polymorphus]|nr:hypothetical protein [Chamaesiphon polymorphus]
MPISIEELGLVYSVKLINLLQREQKTPKLNGKVPVIVDSLER